MSDFFQYTPTTDTTDAAASDPRDVPANYRLTDAAREHLRFNRHGLIPAVVQDADSGRVLMMAWMDDCALAFTLATRRGTYWSRSRKEHWIKGLTSGHVQQVESVEYDCDGDTLLLHVHQTAGACHTGATSCFDTGHFALGE